MCISEQKEVWHLMVVISMCMVCLTSVNAEPQVPCFFIFGDSLADNGNNNLLPTLAKVNYPPYGVDFSDGPTGRFTNGRTTVDILGELLGFEKPIDSLVSSVTSRAILRGVNYASGAAGIRWETGKHMGENMNFRRQTRNHRRIISLLGVMLGSRKLAEERLNKCLYWVEFGNNDYINNYFMPRIYPASSVYSPEQYASLLIDMYKQQVLYLYEHGARMVALAGVGQLGCTPNSITTYGTNGSACVDDMNDAVKPFNQKLVKLVDQLNSDFTDAKFVYINSYGMASGDPTAAGFKVWDVGCCKVNKLGQCANREKPCENRNEHVFWDSFHPTESSNIITANRIYKAYDPSDSYPMDVSNLVALFGQSDGYLAEPSTSTGGSATQ